MKIPKTCTGNAILQTKILLAIAKALGIKESDI